MAASTAAPSSYRPAGSLDAANALLPYAGAWNRRRAAHLMRRAGFGGSPADIERLAALGPRDAVSSLVNAPPADAGPPPEITPLEIDGVAINNRASLRMLAGRAGDPETRKQIQMQLRRNEVTNVMGLQRWWLDRMIASTSPLQEKMTLFWHGHYTTAAVQKGVSPAEVLNQNQLFRTYALGNARDLAQKISADPAMLKYLDGGQNRKGHANENYARELMELFTLGIGNYTEDDVRESARAFTGWTVRGPFQGGGATWNPAQHDDGTKTFLGRTGNFGPEDIVKIIFEQQAAPRFLATKLIEYFVYMDPEPALVDGVAALIRRADFNLKPVIATLLASNVFFSDRAYRALVKSPVEFVVGTYQLYGIPNADPATLGVLRSMGQVLFYPPNVKGWPGGAAWLNSQTVLSRENFANAVVGNQMMMRAEWLRPALRSMQPEVVAKLLTDTVLQGDTSAASAAKIAGFLATGGGGQTALSELSIENVEERVRGAAYLTMAMPAFQLA